MAKNNVSMLSTGIKIRRLMILNGYNVKDIQNYLDLSCPQSIYKWFRGESLPTVNNLYQLSLMFGLSMEAIVGIEGIEDNQNRKWKMLSERREKEMNKKEEAVEASVESIRRYDYKGEVFFVISGTLYYQGIYKLYEVCPEKPMRGEKKYSNEEYIRLDPDNYINAIKVKEKQMERMMRQ